MSDTQSTDKKPWSMDKKAFAAVKNYFDRWIDAGMPLFYIDDVLAGVSLIDLYAATGEEKYKEGADRMAEYLFQMEKEAADEEGSIPYRPAQKNGYVFADGVGMASSFLVKYGVNFHNVHGVQLGLRQMRNMFLFGIDEQTGLPYHGFQCKGSTARGINGAEKHSVKYGIIGWGRAVGWMMMGLSRSAYCLKKYLTAENGKEKSDGTLWNVCQSGYEECCREYRQLFGTVKPYQKSNGAFTWQLGAIEGPEDSSATAMIAYAALMWMQQGDGSQEEARELVEKASSYLAGCEKDGKIYRCLAECMGFAEYPQVYGAYPWSLGPGLGVLRKKGV